MIITAAAKRVGVGAANSLSEGWTIPKVFLKKGHHKGILHIVLHIMQFKIKSEFD